jgi:hypothetical protein
MITSKFLHEMQSVVYRQRYNLGWSRGPQAQKQCCKFVRRNTAADYRLRLDARTFLEMEFSGYNIGAVFADLGRFSMWISREPRFVPVSSCFDVTWNPGNFGAHARPGTAIESIRRSIAPTPCPPGNFASTDIHQSCRLCKFG